MTAGMFEQPMPRAAAAGYAVRFKALGDRTRLMILAHLGTAATGEVTASGLRAGLAANGLDLTQPTVSHHMHILEAAGLVRVRRDGGVFVYYRLAADALVDLAAAVAPHLPKGLA